MDATSDSMITQPLPRNDSGTSLRDHVRVSKRKQILSSSTSRTSLETRVVSFERQQTSGDRQSGSLRFSTSRVFLSAIWIVWSPTAHEIGLVYPNAMPVQLELPHGFDGGAREEDGRGGLAGGASTMGRSSNNG